MAIFNLTTLILPLKHSFCRLSTASFVRSKLSLEEKLGIKPRPKRPKSTYLRFLFEIRPKLIAENPKLSVIELNRIAGERWRSLDLKEKERIQNEYKIEWAKYLDEVQDYEKKLTLEEKDELMKAEAKLKQLKVKQKNKEKSAELGKPKKPAASYVRFMQSRLNERGEMSFQDFVQKLKKEWENAPESLKNSLQQSYRRDYAKYKTDLATWERKVSTQGHPELVRRNQRN